MQISGAGGAGQAAQIQQWRDRLFARADQDRSGGLSLEEFSAMASRRRESQGAESPAGIAGTPATSSLQGSFRRLDSNGDGSLSKAEMDAARPGAQPSGGLSAQSLAALLNSQGQENRAQGRHRHSPDDASQRDGGGQTQGDLALRRQIAAYQARQPVLTAGGATLSA